MTKIQRANIWFKVNELGDNIQKKNVSPGECLIIRKQFGIKVKGSSKPLSPITHLDIIGESDGNVEDEYSRLGRVYGSKVVEGVFPGENPNIPLTFVSVGLDETKDKEPEKGVEPVIVPLAQLPKEETVDAESAAEIAERDGLKKLLQQQAQQIEKLSTTVASLLAMSGRQAQQVQQQAPLPVQTPKGSIDDEVHKA